MSSRITTENSDKGRQRGRQREKSDNPVGNRLLVALAGRSRKWLAESTGISESTISDYIRDGIAKADAAITIAEALGIDLAWLLTGKPDVALAITTSTSPADRAQEVEVAEIDLRYGMGATYLGNDTGAKLRVFSREWLRNWTDSSPDQLFWARGQGDSMEPAISEGDILLIDRQQTTLKFADLTWAFAFGEIGMIKRLRPMPDGSLKLLSNNPSVPPETAHDGEVHIIGRVVAVVKKL